MGPIRGKLYVRIKERGMEQMEEKKQKRAVILDDTTTVEEDEVPFEDLISELRY